MKQNRVVEIKCVVIKHINIKGFIIKYKIVLAIIFILIYGVFFYTNIQEKDKRIELALINQIKTLQTHYDITMDYFIEDAKSIRENITQNNKTIDIFSQAQNANKKQKDILRDKLYKFLLPIYDRIKSRGILQLQFVFKDNISFLRMHKPNKYGDDLTTVRYSYKQANDTKKIMIGFEQGRVSHAFRYVSPFFDTKGNHLGSIEISLSSNALQSKLIAVNKIHSHFLVNKNIFNVKVWKTQDIAIKYIQSIEHKDYMFALTEHSSVDQLKKAENNIIFKLKDKIEQGVSSKKQFALYANYKETVKVIAFLPIKNTQNKVVAYIVSYTNNKNISDINKKNNVLIISIFLIMLIFYYFLYKQLNHKRELEIEVKDKTKELKENEEELKILNENLQLKVREKTEEQNQLLEIFDKGDSVLFKWKNDEHWSVNYVSSSVEKLLGYKVSDFYENKISYEKCIYKDDLNKVMQEVARASQLDTNDYFQHQPYRIKTKDGDIKWVIDYTLIIRDEDNNIIHYIGHINDITDLKNKETQLYKSEKMVSMGEMIGNIAHQWRQPLSIIATGATGMKMQKQFGTLDDKLFFETCDTINNNAQYLSKTIDDFRNFIRGEREKTVFKLSDEIDSFLHLVEGAIKGHYINIVLNLQDDIKIDGYASELTQCFINIFNNAKDALNENKINYKLLFISTSTEKNNVIIKIKDNAGGVPKDIINKIFEPYFTTKHKSQGTGLGLHMTYNLISNGMNGTIEINNVTYEYEEKEYTGAKFVITLPLSQ
ncbi:MAG: hypothetical protein DRG78_10700 [Epsilonproteobacteria bacterium]|nr:MAG: hypothetical protein DRG78_10700 [Campylobacterota bacterium]